MDSKASIVVDQLSGNSGVKKGRRDIFISYSRCDKTFVRKLYDAFVAHDRSAWVDWEDIPAYAYWREEIRTGILSADAVLFIISPDSIESLECNKELEYAIAQNKRLLPIIHRDIDRAAHHTIKPEIGEINWFSLRETDDFEQAFQGLLRAIDTDLEYVQRHTRVAMRADEWLQNLQDHSFLLRGSGLETVEQWLAQATGKQPFPTDFQRQYISLSRLMETARQKVQARRRTAMFAIGLLALVLTSVSAVIAERRRQQAVQGEIAALASSSDARFVSDRKFEALLQGLRAGIALQQARFARGDRALSDNVMPVLTQAVFWVQEQNRLQGHTDWVGGISFSPDGQTIATASGDGTIKLWQRDGRLIKTLKDHTDAVSSVVFSPDGQWLVSGGLDKTVRLWRSDGTLLKTLQVPAGVRTVRFSPNGQGFAAGGDDNMTRLWRMDGTLVATLKGHGQRVDCLRFSPDGQTIATASDDNTVKLWQRDGKLIKTLKGHQAQVIALSFSPDGQVLASGGLDKTIRLWRRDGTLIKSITQLSDGVRALSYSPDGKLLASGGEDYAVKLWQPDGTLLTTLTGHRNAVADLSFSPDGMVLGSASHDSTIKLWRTNSSHLTVLTNAAAKNTNDSDRIPNTARFSPDGQRIIVANTDGTVKLWQRDGTLLNTFNHHDDRANAATFSPDGQTLASASNDGTVKLWQLNVKRLRTLKGKNFQDVAFSPDGQTDRHCRCRWQSAALAARWQLSAINQRTHGLCLQRQF